MTFSDGIFLQPFNYDDHIFKTFGWVSNFELQRLFLLRDNVVWDEHEKYFKKILTDSSQKVYAILANGKHIGNCGLKNIDLKKNEAELWIYIGKKSEQGKGIGRFATELLIQKVFQEFGIEMIFIHVADFNIRALSMYRSIGFREVNLKNNGEWADRGCNIVRMELYK